MTSKSFCIHQVIVIESHHVVYFLSTKLHVMI